MKTIIEWIQGALIIIVALGLFTGGFGYIKGGTPDNASHYGLGR